MSVWARTVGVAGVALVVLRVAGPEAAAARPARHSSSGTLYLTFDADMTVSMQRRLREGRVRAWYDPAVIDYLRTQGLPATFFVSGLFAETYPDLVTALARDPLISIGDHGYLHAAFATPCYGLPVLGSDAAKLEDVKRAQAVLEKFTGAAPTRFRYPGLCHDDHDDALVTSLGLTIDRPTIVAGDAFSRDVTGIVREVLRRAKDGATICLHIGGPNAPVTGEVLRTLVPALEAAGYRFGKLGA